MNSIRPHEAKEILLKLYRLVFDIFLQMRINYLVMGLLLCSDSGRQQQKQMRLCKCERWEELLQGTSFRFFISCCYPETKSQIDKNHLPSHQKQQLIELSVTILVQNRAFFFENSPSSLEIFLIMKKWQYYPLIYWNKILQCP